MSFELHVQPLGVDNLSSTDPGTLSDDSGFSAAQSFLQSRLWARHKQAFGWQAHAFLISPGTNSVQTPAPAEPELSFTLLVLTRKIAGSLALAYVPHGPSEAIVRALVRTKHEAGKVSSVDLLQSLARGLQPHLPHALVLRFDLEWNSGDFELSNRPGFRKASADIQPPDSVVLPIDAEKFSEDDILVGMKSKTRYNVRLSAKKGVEIERVSRSDGELPSELASWYELYRVTEERNKIALHSRRYYEHLFEVSDADECRLYLARHEGELLAGIIVMKYGKRGWYVYGASSNHKRNLMPAYGLQWQAIRDLRTEGAVSYDVFGIPPEAGPGHPMHGLYQFKTGFGGEIEHRPGAWDVPLKPVFYAFYRLAERLRMYYYRVFRKRS